MYVAAAAAAPVAVPSGPLDGANCAIPVCSVPGGTFTKPTPLEAGLVAEVAPNAPAAEDCPKAPNPVAAGAPNAPAAAEDCPKPPKPPAAAGAPNAPPDAAPKAFAPPPKGAATADCQAPHTAQTYASGCAEGAKQSLTGSGMRGDCRAQYGLKPGRMQEHLCRRLHQREADRRQNHQKHWWLLALPRRTCRHQQAWSCVPLSSLPLATPRVKSFCTAPCA